MNYLNEYEVNTYVYATPFDSARSLEIYKEIIDGCAGGLYYEAKVRLGLLET